MLYGVLVAFHGVIGDSSGMIAEIIGIEVSSILCFMIVSRSGLIAHFTYFSRLKYVYLLFIVYVQI